MCVTFVCIEIIMCNKKLKYINYFMIYAPKTCLHLTFMTLFFVSILPIYYSLKLMVPYTLILCAFATRKLEKMLGKFH